MLHSVASLSLGLLTCSLFDGVWSRALFVSDHSTRRMLALPPSRAVHPQSIAFRSSTQASRFFFAEESNIWFPFFQLGRSRQAVAPLLPVVQGILQSHSLVFRNFPNHSTHRCGADLEIILSTPTLPGCVTVHPGSNCCSFANLCCPLLSSDQKLCSCHLDILQASLPPNSAKSLRGTSLSWPTLHALFLTYLRVLPLWTHSSAPSPKSSSTVHPFALVMSRPRTRQPLWWNDACHHTFVARNGSWRDFRRSGSHEDQARFRLLRQQIHSTVRSSRTNFWNEWLGSVTSLSRRVARLACSLIRRTFQSPTVTPDLCLMQWHAPPALPFLLMRRDPNGAPAFPLPLGTPLFSDDFFHSLSLRLASLTSLHESGRFDASLSYNELVVALSKCHESAPGADCLPYSLFKVSFPCWRHLLLSFFNLVLRFAVVPSTGKSS